MIELGGNIIEFGGALSQPDVGVLTESEEVFLQDVVDNRDMWSASSIFFISILVGFVLITKNGIEKYNKTEKRINKIKKKYGDWIVEVEKPPKGALGSETITIKSLEDLIKTSEELGDRGQPYEVNRISGPCSTRFFSFLWRVWVTLRRTS